MEQRKSLEQAIGEMLNFTTSTFLKASTLSSLKKLQEETSETILGIEMNNSENIKEEFADLIGCVYDAAYRQGLTPYDLTDALVAKTAKNKKREWEWTGEVYKHKMNDWEDQK
jgi:phosphoribosyl-ATP pyrophosphohydrolase